MKLNSSLLGDISYVREVKKTIKSIKNRYALSVYNHENIYEIPNSEIQFIINDHLFFGNVAYGNTRENNCIRIKQTKKKAEE